MKHPIVFVALITLVLIACAITTAPASKPVNTPATIYPTNLPPAATTYIPIVYQEDPAGEVFTVSVDMTDWVVAVESTKVYGSPEATQVGYLYALPRGTLVTVRELDPRTRTWAMIKPAHWVRFADLASPE